MIVRLSGQVASVGENSLVLLAGDVGYEVFVPAVFAARLVSQPEARVSLHTLQLLEGNAAVGHLTPRLYGFPSAAERDFAQLLTKVKGISLRKALRMMSLPLAELAGAIHRADTRLLVSLPDIGKKTAAELVNLLRDLMPPYLSGAAPDASETPRELSQAQRVALELLLSWGERPVEAQRWIAEALEQQPALHEPDEIVSAAYRVKLRTR